MARYGKLGVYLGHRGQGLGVEMADFVFSRPSWLTGFARTLDIGGVFDSYYTAIAPAHCDWMALTQDMTTVRRDFVAALDRTEDSRTWLLSNQDMLKVRMEVMRHEIAKHAELVRTYEAMRERLASEIQNDATDVQKSRPEEELSWAG